MYIAREKRQSNIAEYLLYMWQLEDILRACKFDPAVIRSSIVDKYQAALHEKAELQAWYEQMALAMSNEGLQQTGHLMFLNHLVQDLSDLNIYIIKSETDEQYKNLFNKVMPYIVDILEKSKGSIKNEIDACLSVLYGVLLLRLQQKPISEGTQQAAKDISQLLSALSKHYREKEEREKDM